MVPPLSLDLQLEMQKDFNPNTTTTYSLIINYHFDRVSIGLALSIEVSGAAILLKPLDEAPVKVGKSNEHLDVSY